jgi:imidazoleglycerol phosphate dehydratase HisB
MTVATTADRAHIGTSGRPLDPALGVRGQGSQFFRFMDETIDNVVVDVSGERYVDHEATVRAWFFRD